MAENKLVFDVRANKDGISQAESNEQQRNWSDNFLQRKASDPQANYDPTRAHLNFEVTKGGKIQPIDCSRSIMKKMDEILKARGIKDPNAREYVRRRQNTLAQIILGGSRNRMNEIAFGHQLLNLQKGADNSSLTREHDIELWAIDAYNFIAQEFGEENIISFYVHLDETNVHAHCTLIPVNMEQNRISWRTVFGINPHEEKQTFYRLHDEYANVVGTKWGLERGDSIKETGARHRSTSEYKRELVNEVNQLEKTKGSLEQQISQAEKKLKGISTMIENLLQQQKDIEAEIDLLAQKFGQEGIDASQLVDQMRQLRQEKDRINETLLKRYQQLEDAKNAISIAQEKLAGLKEKNEELHSVIADKLSEQAAVVQMGIVGAFGNKMCEATNSAYSSLPIESINILDKAGLTDMANNMINIINCAMLLAVNYVDEATNYANSCGGAGSNLSNWGRDKDEDDERWWLRCVTKASAMVKPPSKRMRYGR